MRTMLMPPRDDVKDTRGISDADQNKLQSREASFR